jgi:diadenosine tetraphosphate (Ap4A) HIT family hydrolase
MTCSLCFPIADVIASTPLWRIVWANEAGYPCFVRVVWQNHVTEMTDLSSHDRHELLRVVLLVEAAMRHTLEPTPRKINLASLGNQVAHLHWHIVARYDLDSHWPNSTFSSALRSSNPDLVAQQIAQRPALALAIQTALHLVDDA